MSPELDGLSEAELAEWHYAHREELDTEEGEIVDVEISPQLSITMSFRLPGAEADAIREAARSAGLSLSEWIRQACADAIDRCDGRRHKVAVELERVQRQFDGLKEQLEAVARANREMPANSGSAKTNRKRRRSGSSSRRSSRHPSED